MQIHPNACRRDVGRDKTSYAVDAEALRAENTRLRQRLEELQEISDRQGTTPAATASRGAGVTRRTVGGRGVSGSLSAVRVGAGAGGAAGAACDAILRGQVAQLRRQVRLQWCAVDASAAVTQEVRHCARNTV